MDIENIRRIRTHLRTVLEIQRNDLREQIMRQVYDIYFDLNNNDKNILLDTLNNEYMFIFNNYLHLYFDSELIINNE